MSSLIRMVRFIVGLALVVGGAALAAPYACDVLAAHAVARRAAVHRDDGRGVGQSDGITGPEIARERPVRGSYASHSIQDHSLGGWELRQEDAAGVPEDLAPWHPDVEERPAREYSPPPVPAAMPQAASGWSQSPPPLDAAYRSTLDVPPPPLLDADAPPPLAVAWTANDGPRNGGPAAPPPGLQQSPPTTYVVRDGDDLTGIATKIYGHPGAAGAIWSFNRDRLTDPALLPIGMELRIPPSWNVPAMQGSAAAAPTIEPARRPGRVRVAPGETLESLAQRFYGDRAMAARLWEANRDQLRSPALLVAGMELRLP